MVIKIIEPLPSSNVKKFKEGLEAQEKKVYEKINPILYSYDRGKLTKKELIEKLAYAFHSLEEEE